MISSDVSEGIEIAPYGFFNKKTGRLKDPNCEVYNNTQNRHTQINYIALFHAGKVEFIKKEGVKFTSSF